MTRQEANRQILEKIADIVEREPDWRFHQILQNTGIEVAGCDQWFDESVETLKNIVDYGTEAYSTYEIFVHPHDQPWKPSSKEVSARNIDEAVDRLSRSLDKDTCICSASDGRIWYCVKPGV